MKEYSVRRQAITLTNGDPLSIGTHLSELIIRIHRFSFKPIISWWRYQMETFSVLLAFVRGIHRSPVNFLHKGQWRGALMFSFIFVWINSWVNNRKAGDLRRFRAIMTSFNVWIPSEIFAPEIKGRASTTTIIMWKYHQFHFLSCWKHFISFVIIILRATYGIINTIHGNVW